MSIKSLLIVFFLNIAFMTQTFSSFRELLIFGEADNPALVDKQMQLLQKDMEGIKERDINVVRVKKESSLCKKYLIKSGSFTMVLIGKDKTEKYRTNKLIDIAQLFAVIDGMPMRKEEMKKKG